MKFVWQTTFGVAHTECLLRSYWQVTGRQLLSPTANAPERARQLFEAPFVVVSHGTEADPILNYGNAAALSLWGMDWDEFTRTPSRFTAELPNQEERARLLARVTARGFIDDYSGVRISKDRRRFRIAQATVWNLLTVNGQPCGQAATFACWQWLCRDTPGQDAPAK
jgi:hypothetical protein